MSNIIVFPVATLLCWPSAPPDSRRQTEKFIHEWFSKRIGFRAAGLCYGRAV